MTRQHLPAKLTPPALSMICERKQLLARLHQSKGVGITWIQGPPGAGKTSLAVSWADTQDRPPVWFQLDAEDGDPACFFYYLQIAVRRFVPRAHLPSFTQDWADSPVAFSRHFFRKLAEYERAPKMFIFDDYHALPKDSSVHAALAEGLPEQLAGLQIMFISREDTPAELSRRRINGQINFIAPSELLLTRDECKHIAKLRNVALDGRRISELIERADGWAAGFVVLLAADVAVDNQRANGSHLFEYYSREVLARIDPETREVLLKTSFLPEITGDCAVYVTENERAGALLNRLAERGYFVYRLCGKDTTYRFHHLFRDFLTNHARQVLGDRLVSLRMKAAHHLRKNDKPEAALSLACEAGDWETAAAIVLETAPQLLRQGRLALIREQTDCLPTECLEHTPWLQYWSALALFPVDPDRAIQMMAPVYHAFVHIKDPNGSALALAAIIEFFVFFLDDLHPLTFWIERLDEIEDMVDFLSPEAFGALATAAVAALSHHRPDHPSLTNWTVRAFDLAMRGNDQAYRFSAGRAVLWYFGFWGADLHRTEILLRALTPLMHDADPMNRILWLVGQANYHLYQGDAALTLDAARQGLAVADESGYHRWDAILVGLCVWAELLNDDVVAANRTLARLADMTVRAPKAMRLLYHYIASIYALRIREYPLVVKEAAIARELAEDIGLPFADAAAFTGQAIARSAGGNPDALEAAMLRCRQTGYRIGETTCCLATALQCIKSGDEGTAREVLSQGFRLSRELGVFHLVWIHIEDYATLCSFAALHKIDPEYLTKLVEKRNVPADRTARQIEDWPWPVRVHVLEGGECTVLHAPSLKESSVKTPRRPLELLRALIDAGPRGCSTLQLIDLFWPNEDDEEKSKNSLYIIVHRLRQLLGRTNTVLHRDGRFVINAQSVYVDVWDLKELIGRAESLTALSSPEGKALIERIERLWEPVDFISSEEYGDSLWINRLGPRIHRLRRRDGWLRAERNVPGLPVF